MMKPFHRSLLTGVSTLALFAGLGADEGLAQVACVAGSQPNACTVADGQTVLGVITSGAGSTIDNAGMITNQLRTDGANSAVTNSGSVGSYIRTTGVGSGVTNTGSVGTFLYTSGNNSAVTNSGTVGSYIRTQGTDSAVTNSDSVDTHILTEGTNSGVANSGTVGTFLATDGANSGVTNSGSVGTFLATDGDNSGVTNSGSVDTFLVTTDDNSGVTNTGSVGTYLGTLGVNSAVTNSGSVGTFLVTTGDNSGVTNSGTIGGSLQTTGANSAVTNSGSVGTRLVTQGTNSAVTNSDSVGTFLVTTGYNSGVTNSGSIGTYLVTQGANSAVTNSGSVGTFLVTAGDNSGVTNSGSIGSGAAGGGIAIQGANPDLTLLPGSVIQGFIDLSGAGTRTLNVGNGLSIANTFFATSPNVINSNGAPVAVNGLQVAVVDPTGIAMQDEVITDLTNNISNSVFNALKSARSGAGSGPSGGEQPLFLSGSGSASGSPETATRYWGKVFGSRRQQEGTGPTVDSEHWVVGTVSGVDAPISANTRAGGFLGGSTGEVEVAFDSQETEIDSFFGGFYAGTRMGVVTLDVMVTGGWTEHERERKVANNLVATGIQTARADFNGTFIAPEIAVSVDTGLFVPSAKVRYTAFHLDGFQETGALGNFSVDDRDLHILQGRLQIAMPIISSGEDSSYTKFEPYVGIEGRSIVSGESVDAILLGQSISFNPGGDDDVFSVYAGFNGSARVASNVELFVNAEANFEDDDTYRYGGNVGAKVTF